MVIGDRRSTSFRRREALMRTLRVPTISEIKTNLGLPLSLVVFEESSPHLQEDMGLTPCLQGPSGELWVSPSDLLIGKVCLKPPLTQKHTQALTHQGILEIGGQIEQKFWREMEIERDEAMREREDYLTRIFELEKNKAIEDAIKLEREKRIEEVEAVRKVFEDKINELTWNCYTQVKELEEEQAKEIDSLNTLWQQKLDAEINYTVDSITEEFLEKLRLQEQILVDIFNKQINNLKWNQKCALEFEKIKSKELVLQLKHNLECQNLANLMYVLCKERRKCKGESIELDKYYGKIINRLENDLRNRDKQIQKLIRIKNRKQKQLGVREKCLIEILRQFKKFIYYALKASPTQGEFLLNIDKLVKYEIDDYCFNKREEEERVLQSTAAAIFEAESPTPDDLSDKQDIMQYFEASENQLFDEDEDQTEESDAHPAFFFNEKLYVREDFRDMFSAGIEIDRKHPLWNKDVEELLNIFKETIAKKRSDQVVPIKSHPSSVHFTNEECRSILSSDSIIMVNTQTERPSSKSPIPSESVKPRAMLSPQSVANKKPPQSVSNKRSPSSFEDDELEIRKVSLAGSIDDSKKKIAAEEPKRKNLTEEPKRKRSILPTVSGSEDFELRPQAATPSRLMLARDSIILQISAQERRSLQQMSKIVEETVSTVSPKNVKEDKIANVQSKESPINDEQIPTREDIEGETDVEEPLTAGQKLPESQGSRPTSRLTLAQDSLELIRSTIAITGEDEQVVKEPVKIDPTFKSAPKTTKRAVPLKTGKAAKPQSRKTVKTTSTPHKPVAKVVGTRQTKEHLKPAKQFTDERIKSLVDLMKENPSLIGLFTKCSN